jgi:hypothetical protein
MIEESKEKGNNKQVISERPEVVPATQGNIDIEMDTTSNQISREQYIMDMLNNNIHVATETIDELYKEIEEAYKLPNDCLNIEIDGEICYNRDLKIDIISGHLHTIGYMECLKHTSELMMGLLYMNEDDFQKYLIEENQILEENEKYMNTLINEIKK